MLGNLLMFLFTKLPIFKLLDGKKGTIGNILVALSTLVYAVEKVYPTGQIAQLVHWLDVLMIGLGVKVVGDEHAKAKAKALDFVP